MNDGMMSFFAKTVFISLFAISCIDQGNQLLKITNTMNIITILKPTNFKLFFAWLILQCKTTYELYFFEKQNRYVKILP